MITLTQHIVLLNGSRHGNTLKRTLCVYGNSKIPRRVLQKRFEIIEFQESYKHYTVGRITGDSTGYSRIFVNYSREHSDEKVKKKSKYICFVALRASW